MHFIFHVGKTVLVGGAERPTQQFTFFAQQLSDRRQESKTGEAALASGPTELAKLINEKIISDAGEMNGVSWEVIEFESEVGVRSVQKLSKDERGLLLNNLVDLPTTS